MTKKLLVTFSDEVWNTIKKDVMPKLGEGDSEVVRQMVIGYLESKGYLLKDKIGDIKTELASQEIMIAALVQTLSEKGLINFDEWEKRVSAQVQ